MTDPPLASPRLERFAWAVLAYNLAVILWGAFVRISFSGDGCGASWPTCDGRILPSLERWETMVEFIHRLSSTPALVAVLALAVLVHRRTRPGSALRRAAWGAVLFILGEALLGAGIVLLGKVARDESVSRAGWMGAHLVNTFLLLACLTLVAWWLRHGEPGGWRPRSARGVAFGAAVLGFFVLGVSGAVTALGDTLFRPERLGGDGGAAADGSLHVFQELRALHPVLAVGVGAYLVVLASRLAGGAWGGPRLARVARFLQGALVVQLLVGAVNLALLAPAALQILHLLMADLVWIGLVLTGAEALRGDPAS